MASVILLLAVGVTIYALVDCWRIPVGEVRELPRSAWIFTILGIPLLGALAYLALGREQGLTNPERRPRRALAPDDDPDFLRQLDFQHRKRQDEIRRAQQRQARRERKNHEGRPPQREQHSTGGETTDDDDHLDHPTG